MLMCQYECSHVKLEHRLLLHSARCFHVPLLKLKVHAQKCLTSIACCVRCQVITCADFHPQHCHMFAYSSSKGCIRLGDMRSAALCDRHAKAFQEQDLVSCCCCVV